MSEDFHYVGEVGTIIEVDTGVDLTAAGATVTEIHIEKPDKTTVELTGTITGTGDTKIKATLFDLVLSGTYTVHAYVELPTPWEGLGKAATFRVYEKYSTPT